MAALRQNESYGRPSELRDVFAVPILALLLLIGLGLCFVVLSLREPGMSAERLVFLHEWKGILLAGLGLPGVLSGLGTYRLRRLVYRRETQILDREQGLGRMTAKLEQSVLERTAALSAEVLERRRMELLNRNRSHVLEMLVKNDSLDAMLAKLLTTLVDQVSTWGAAVHCVEGKSLRLRGSAGLPEMLVSQLERIGTEFGEASEAEAVRAGDFASVGAVLQARTPWTQLLSAHGVRSTWSMPFFGAEGEAVGAITIYSRLQTTDQARQAEALEAASAMAALIFKHQQLNRQLHLYAYHDALTSLPNRRLGEDRLETAIAHRKRSEGTLAVLWLDVDHFKETNDAHGHPAGDLVLQEIARRLVAGVRAADTVARMGGDEFMVVLGEVDSRDAAERVAAMLYQTLAMPIDVGEKELRVTTSIGISLFPEDGATAEQLKQNADYAMYQAKSERTGTQVFFRKLGEQAASLRQLKEALARSLEQGGFELDYQPQFDAASTTLGFEALLRFHHPVLGTISPVQFIPLAEEMGLIVPLGAWVLESACRQSLGWQAMGHEPLPIAVNISAVQFARPQFAAEVATVLQQTGIDPALLELELTESVLMKDFEESVRQLRQLKRLGLRIAVDDFGTGYSSLSYLHRLPVDVLKLDRSFIAGMLAAQGTLPIVQAVLAMAHSLGMEVVAEGVETNDQLAILRENGCDRVQGWLFAPALRPEKAANFLRSVVPELSVCM